MLGHSCLTLCPRTQKADEQGLEAVQRRSTLLKLIGQRAAPGPAPIPLAREIPLDWGGGSKDTALGREGLEEGLGADQPRAGAR